jgi:hypothetical protein
VRLDRWDEIGDHEQTEHWRSVLPDLSLDPGDDLTEVANTGSRVAEIRQHYARDFKHLTGPRGSWHGSTATGLTRLCDWSPLTNQEQTDGRGDSPFALSRGVPSGLAHNRRPLSEGALDFAIRVSVPPPFLPRGLLLLDGVPLVVHRRRPFRPLPGNADELWPPEAEIPDYLAD